MIDEPYEPASTAGQPSRREVLGFAAAATAAACAACRLASAAPPASSQPAGRRGETVDAGPIAAFSADGVYDALARTKQVLILRDGGRLVAASARCPHRGAIVERTGKADPALRCPKHDSTFDADGIVLDGPAKTSLPRFAIRAERGRAIVDTSRSFDERDWNDPAASLPIAS